MKKSLPSVTLVGVDCVNLRRLAMAAEVCREKFDFGDIKLLSSLPANGHANVVPIEPIRSIKSFSTFMVSQLYRHIQTPHMLVIQWDGFILNQAAWTDDFLHFDYIGAPWNHLGPNLQVGNGGFSLRSRKIMETVAITTDHETVADEACHPEDLWICRHKREFLESYGMRFAPMEVAQYFSFEADMFHWKWKGQFGFHGGKWRTNISRWLKENPDYKWMSKQGLVRP